MTRAKDISKIVTDADLSGTLDVTGEVTTADDIKFTSGSRHKFVGGGTGNNLELGTYSSSNTSRDVHLQIDSAGNVGIGTSSPNSRLTSASTDGSTGLSIHRTFSGNVSGETTIGGLDFTLTDTATSNQVVSRISPVGSAGTGDAFAGAMRFYTAGTNGSIAERMRIDSSGNVGIGTSSPTYKIDGGFANQTWGWYLNASYSSGMTYNTTERSLSIHTKSAENIDHIKFATGGSATERMRITSAGAMTMGTTTSQTAVSGITLKNDVQSGYPTLLFLQNQPGTGGTMGADIHMGYASDYGSILRFYGNPFNRRQGGFEFRRVTGSGTSDLSMRINEDGNVGIGDSSNIARLMVESNFSSFTGVNIKNNHSVATGFFINFTNTNGTQAGGISHNGSTTVAYNTSSDHRLKENVVAMTDATTRLKQLQPKRFNFIADADTTVDGFIAHEVQEVVPEAITGTKDAVDDDGNPVYQGIDQSKLVPLLVKTIQELESRIVALETA